MNETANTPGFSRLAKHILLGGVFGGALSAIPVLNMLNCLFCLLNISGVVLALWMYLNANPQDNVSLGESAGFGAIAGAVAGLISGVLNLFFGVAAMSSILDNLPNKDEALASVGTGAALGVLALPLTITLFAGFGALGAALGMQFLFKPRIRKP